jgi:Mn-dependent DtxR family transcriptional regulator
MKLSLRNTGARIKDQILQVIDKEFKSSIAISSEINVDEEVVSYMVEVLKDDGMVTLMPITARGNQYGVNQYHVSITAKGKFFHKNSGGYKSKSNSERFQTIWLFVKTVAAIVNALTIIYLTYLAVKG